MNYGLNGFPSVATLLLDRLWQRFAGGIVVAGEWDIGASRINPPGTDPSLAIPASVTPEPGNGPFQAGLNNGAFALNASPNYGSYKLRLVNGASAGTVTLSGFDKTFSGDAYDTTAGHQFDVYVTIAGKKTVLVKALQ